MHIHVARSLGDIENATEMATGETWGHARDFLKRVGKDQFADHLRWVEEAA